MAKQPCVVAGCDRPKIENKHRCYWHYLLAQPIEAQIRNAEARLAQSPQPPRARVPERDWPPGERWCAGCQSFVPLFYARGSRCRACASRAAHASHVARTYGLPPETYDRLLTWQGGRCYICGVIPRKTRLAVDHDHETGEVRGLLCAGDQFGCNVALRRLLGHPSAGQRLAEYNERTPLERMLAGEENPATRSPQPAQDRRTASPGTTDSWESFLDR